MSIKKKPNNKNYISRKKLFQFLFKSYIKSAYSGISSQQQMPSNGNELRREYYNDMNDCCNEKKRSVTQYVNSSSSKVITTKTDIPVATITTATSVTTAITAITATTASGIVATSSITPKTSTSTITLKTITAIPASVPTIAKTTPTTPVVAAISKIQTKTIITLADGQGDAETIEQMRRNMTVTKANGKKFDANDDITWGNKISVSLVRGPNSSFGVCIVGGKVNINNTQISGIFIKNIIPKSPAELSKQIKVGDRILSVNGHDVSCATQDEAISLIKNAGCSIDLVLQSFDSNDTEKPAENNNEPNKKQVKLLPPTINYVPKQEYKEPTKKVTSDSECSSSDDDEDEEAGKVFTRAGIEIDRKSAGNIKRSKDEAAMDEEPENEFGYTHLKLKKKYGTLGNIIRARIQRDNNNSMGLALAGHRNRNEMGTFIAGINPKGNANSQDIKIGDEILEINGRVVHKLCHLNTSVIIKGIPGVNLEFILLRRESVEDHLAVKPVTNFPTVFDQFDQLYSCFKNVRNVTIQKIGTSLGIMIIEGKHSDVGQGIFISDIQENSNAEVAGVKIGEMILAVNKDLLIDCNYDAAAALLKRAEGIVTLTLCNPNKKEESSDLGKADDPNASANKSSTKIDVKKNEPTKSATPEPDAPPQDPATAEIRNNKETVIEINADNKPLGVIVIKGDPSVVQAGVCVILIHSNGAVHKDNRIKVFDKIVEFDGVKMSSETTDEDIRKKFRTLYTKVKMTIYRADPFDLKEMEVDVTKKPGKDIGLGFAECKGTGVYVTEIIPGSIIDLDKRTIKGDIITHINGEDIRNSDFFECSLLIKAAQPKLTLRIVRPKGKK